MWHERFEHAGKPVITNLPSNVKGVPQRIDLPQYTPCIGCELGKSKRVSFPLSSTKTTTQLALVHMDLVEYPVSSIDGYKYTLTTLDDFSSFGLMWYFKRKSDAFTAFKSFVAWAENQSNHKLKAICSDQGGEFLNKEFNAYLLEKEIERQLSVAHMPQQNGRAKRWQQTIQTKAEAMRHYANLSNGF